jgi:hypothetical protein
VVNSGTINVGILLGYDNNTFANLTTYSTNKNAHIQSVAIGDFNNDAKIDVVFTDMIHATVNVLIGNGNGTFERGTNYNTADMSSPSQVIDSNCNNDSQVDIVVVNSGTDNIGIFLGYGNVNFRSQKTFSTDKTSLLLLVISMATIYWILLLPIWHLTIYMY